MVYCPIHVFMLAFVRNKLMGTMGSLKGLNKLQRLPVQKTDTHTDNGRQRTRPFAQRLRPTEEPPLQPSDYVRQTGHDSSRREHTREQHNPDDYQRSEHRHRHYRPANHYAHASNTSFIQLGIFCGQSGKNRNRELDVYTTGLY